MRISDWSSDVCSSDLIGVAKTGGEVAMFHIYLVALVAFAVPTAAAAAPVSIVGRWKTDDGKGIVDIVPCGAKLCGRIGSEERRVGKECVSTFSSRWSPDH